MSDVERQQQPYDPEYPAGKPPGPPPKPEGKQETELKKRVLWVQSRQIPAPPGSVALNLMSLPASAAVDVFISYTQPGTAQTITSPDGREIFRLYVNEQLTTQQITSFSPLGHVPGGGGNPLPPMGRVFAIRDIPVDGWQLTIDTSLMVQDSDHAPPTLYLNITCVGWAKEPTGIGPFALTTLQAGAQKTDALVPFIPTGGLDNVIPPAFALVQIFNQLAPWSPDTEDLAGAANVIIAGIDLNNDVHPVPINDDGSLQASPKNLRTNFTTALAGSLVVANVPRIIVGVSGRIDATAPTGTYYVQLWDLSAVPADSTAVTQGNGAICAPIKIQHSFGSDDYFDFELPDGFDGLTGFTITLSTTEFTKSASPGNFMSATGSYKTRFF